MLGMRMSFLFGWAISIFLIGCLSISALGQTSLSELRSRQLVMQGTDGGYELTADGASYFARLSLMCTTNDQEYSPFLPSPQATRSDLRRAHWPSFYGCYDWHSAVHNHWCLVKLLKHFPDLPEAAEIRMKLNQSLSSESIQRELAFFQRDDNRYFEFPYGQSWLLELACELKTWNDQDAQVWLENLRPLHEFIADCHLDYWPSRTWAKLSGSHDSPAMALSFTYDYATCFGQRKLRKKIVQASKRFYLHVANVPLKSEPLEYDFMSAGLLVADLMRKTLPEEQFEKWIVSFAPELFSERMVSSALQIKRTGKHDGMESHWDGYHLNRIWCLHGVMSALSTNTLTPVLKDRWLSRMNEMWDYAQGSIGVENYDVDHWLSSFSVYALLGHQRKEQ